VENTRWQVDRVDGSRIGSSVAGLPAVRSRAALGRGSGVATLHEGSGFRRLDKESDMTLDAGWLQRQLDRVAEDVQKWPDWMKREAEFAPPNSSMRESHCESEEQAKQTMRAGGEGRC
jgi:hypothetical protein